MKVEFSANIGLYGKTSATVQGAAKAVPTDDVRGKTDVAEFTHGTAVANKSVTGVKASVLREISANRDAKRLEELSQRIKDGTYRVSSYDLADAIMTF